MFGFSILGALLLLAPLVPNLLRTRRKPRGCAPSWEDRRLTLLERVGQVWALLSRGFVWQGGWPWWLPGVVVLGIGHIGIHLEYHKEALR